MSIKEKLSEDLKTAMRAKDEITSLVLRGLNAEISNKEIELNKREEGLGDDEIQQIVVREIKKRQDSIEQYEKGDRGDLAENEKRELEILQKYAPEQMSEEELSALIDATIKETGAAGPQDMGKVMKEVMAKAGAAVDGSAVSGIVREKLK